MSEEYFIVLYNPKDDMDLTKEHHGWSWKNLQSRNLEDAKEEVKLMFFGDPDKWVVTGCLDAKGDPVWETNGSGVKLGQDVHEIFVIPLGGVFDPGEDWETKQTLEVFHRCYEVRHSLKNAAPKDFPVNPLTDLAESA